MSSESEQNVIWVVLPPNVLCLFSVAMDQEQHRLNGVSFQPSYDADIP